MRFRGSIGQGVDRHDYGVSVVRVGLRDEQRGGHAYAHHAFHPLALLCVIGLELLHALVEDLDHFGQVVGVFF
jgi:hypothetical protein